MISSRKVRTIPGILQSTKTKGADTMAVMNINSKKLKAMIENGESFLVDFWAPWCPHCRKINPAYEQIAEQYAGVLDVV